MEKYGNSRSALSGAPALLENGPDAGAPVYVGPSHSQLSGLARAFVGDESFEACVSIIEEGLKNQRNNLAVAKQGIALVKHELSRRAGKGETLAEGETEGGPHEVQNPKLGTTWLEYLTNLLTKYQKISQAAVTAARQITDNSLYVKIAAAAVAHTAKDMMEKNAMSRRKVTLGSGERQALEWSETEEEPEDGQPPRINFEW